MNQTFYLQIKTVQSIAQYKQLITSSLQRFSVHYGSILHLKINILIYIYISSFPCPSLNRQRHDRNEKNPFFRIRKSGLSPSELHGLTHQSPLFRTQKSLVSRLTQILYDRPHLQGESTSPFLQPLPCSSVFSSGFPPPIWTTVSLPMPASNPDRKRSPIPAPRNS